MEIEAAHAAGDMRKSCDFCTSRKRRCDRVGTNPCTLCSEKGTPCTFRLKSRRGPKPRTHRRQYGVANGEGAAKGCEPNGLSMSKSLQGSAVSLQSLQSKIEALEMTSAGLDRQQEEVLAALEFCGAYRGIENKADLVDTLKSVRKEKEYLLQLRGQLQEEKLILLRMGSNSKRLLQKHCNVRDSEEGNSVRQGPQGVAPPIPLKDEESVGRTVAPPVVDAPSRKRKADDDGYGEAYRAGPSYSGTVIRREPVGSIVPDQQRAASGLSRSGWYVRGPSR